MRWRQEAAAAAHGGAAAGGGGGGDSDYFRRFSRSGAEMANPHQKAAFYGSGPLRSREGLSARSGAGSSGGGEIQVQIDPMHADLDEHISGLHHQIRQLKGVAQEIGTEAKFQNELLAQLQMAVLKAQAGLKNNMRRLNKRIIQQGSNHVVHVVLFALACFFLVYLWSKFSRR